VIFCVSMVESWAFLAIHHRVTKNTEVAQRGLGRNQTIKLRDRVWSRIADLPTAL